MLGEFNRVFSVDADHDDHESQGDGRDTPSSEPLRRNSRQYSDAAADQLLGLSGRTLKPSEEETQSDGDDFSMQDESGTETTEGELAAESSSSSSPVSGHPRDQGFGMSEPDPPQTPTAKNTKAASAAAARGLMVAVTHSERGNRHSRMMGLPSSPRLMAHSPSRPEMPMNLPPTQRLTD
jgi:RalA-binding protein 1